MFRLILLAVCLCAVRATAQEDAGSFKLIDQSVASVDGQVITQSQLEFEARIIFVNAGGVEAAFAPMDRAALSAALETMIDQRLATLEADKLDAWALEPGEIEQAVLAFRARFKDEGRYRQFLMAHEADANDVALVLRRGLRAQRILESKVRLRAQVSPSEAARLIASRADLKGVPTEKARAVLFNERYAQLVRNELQQARKNIDVRMLGPWARAPGTARAMSVSSPEFRLRPMVMGDLDRVMEIEKQAFSNPWSAEMVRKELSNDWSTILVGELRVDGTWKICALAIFWLVVDECHLLNIATDGVFRRQGLGRQMLKAVIAHAKEHKCTRAILEVRRSNAPAIGLYASLGFLKIGLRPNYYADDREDAVVMAADL